MTARTRARQPGEGGDATPPSHRRARGHGLASRVTLTVLVLGSCAGLLAGATLAGFTDTALSGGNQFVSGTVDIDDNDNGVAVVTLTNAGPGDDDFGCITVTSRGTLPSSVRLYGTTTGTGLDQYTTLTVTRGTFTSGPPAFESCTDFQADGVQYIGGQANGVIYNGTLAAFPDDWANGVADPTSGSPKEWTQDESHVYMIEIDIVDTDDAEGLDATQTFVWEARNT